jgi:hypothetical protein
LYKGFFWNLTKGKTGAAAHHPNDDANNVGVDHDEQNVCQGGGKQPMSIDLYSKSLLLVFGFWNGAVLKACSVIAF